MDKKEPWYDKYKKFIFEVNEPCIRIDADVIPSKQIKKMMACEFGKNWLVKGTGYDIYKNDIGVIGCNFYSVRGLQEIRNNWNQVTKLRPEATAWRIPHINNHTGQFSDIIGVHGFYQDIDGVKRAFDNKTKRGQLKDYDFSVIEELMKL